MREIVIWADNCSGQNKNWFLYTALVQCVNSPNSPESITLKYLEAGHTFMAADGVHGAIGRQIKKRLLTTFNSFTIECAASSKTIEVIEMELGDFYDITKGNRASTKYIPALKLEGIVQVTFRKGTSTILVKNSFLDSAREVEFLKKSVLKNNSWKVLPSVLPTRRGITVAKKTVSLVHSPKTFHLRIQTGGPL